MGEGVNGIYRARRQCTSGAMGVCPCTIYQWSKGYFVRLGIIQRSIQNVAYVWYFGAYIPILFIEYNVLFVSIHPVAPPPPTYVCTKRQEHTSANPSIHVVQKSNFTKMPLYQNALTTENRVCVN
jgi:hypothetical protein